MIALAEFVSLMAGFGYPYNGDDLKEGTEQLSLLHAQLNSTYPDSSSWQGTSAQAYTGQTGALQDAIQDLITLDEQLAGAAQRQADLVTHIRLALSILKALLVAGYAVERWYYLAGQDLQGGMKFDLYASIAGTLGVSAIMACSLAFSEDQAKYANSRAKDFSNLDSDQSETGSAVGGLASTNMIAAEETRIVDFESISSSLSALSAPDTSALTVHAPAPAAVAASGQAVQSPVSSYRDLSLVDQTAAQRLTPMTQSSRRADTSTEQPATEKTVLADAAGGGRLDGYVYSAEANTALQAAGRAPIDVATVNPGPENSRMGDQEVGTWQI
ncbi:MAG: hypothetical protein K2Q25_14610 [Mycobacteriaceae bacterium]|nr:hypothetical protein [Mycobacteriaceae bacterium]